MSVHISAEKSEISKIVLICGDPLRAKFFSFKYLDKPKLVSKVRGMFAYTGKIKNTNIVVTVMGHGMGLESIAVYAYELYDFYQVETIIRFGSCGSYSKDIKVWDLVIAQNAWTESNFGIAYGIKENILSANKDLLKIASLIKNEKKIHIGTINSSMWFYQTTNQKHPSYFIKKKIIALEMEAYSLYAVAKALKRKALTILTVSDNLVTNELTSSQERETGFINMFDFLIEFVRKYVKNK